MTNSSFFQEGYGTASTTGGRSWLPAALPATGGSFQGIDLAGASCQGSRCVAVGTQGYSQNAILQYQGGSWLPVAAPQPSAFENSLSGVSCALTACVAVGYATDPGGINLAEALVTTDGGAHWTAASVPHPGAATNGETLQGVSCVGAQCVAVGQYASVAWIEQNEVLVSTNGGYTWTLQAAPQPAGAYADQMLNAVTCSAVGCVAVGQVSGWSGQQPEVLAAS